MLEYAGGHVSPLVLNKIKPWNLLEQVGLQSNCRLIFFLEAARLGHQLNVCCRNSSSDARGTSKPSGADNEQIGMSRWALQHTDTSKNAAV